MYFLSTAMPDNGPDMYRYWLQSCSPVFASSARTVEAVHCVLANTSLPYIAGTTPLLTEHPIGWTFVQATCPLPSCSATYAQVFPHAPKTTSPSATTGGVSGNVVVPGAA